MLTRVPLAPASSLQPVPATVHVGQGLGQSPFLIHAFGCLTPGGAGPPLGPPDSPGPAAKRLRGGSVSLGQEVGWPRSNFPSRNHFPSPFRHLQLAAVLPS